MNKMSEVFPGGVDADYPGIIVNGEWEHTDLGEAEVKALVYAAQNHDRLTERVKALEAAFENLREYSLGHQKALDVANEMVRVCNEVLKAGE
jgi:hypothetical protein